MKRGLTIVAVCICLCAVTLGAPGRILERISGPLTAVLGAQSGEGPSPDCNQNAIPDDCDLDCAAQGGACQSYPSCGLLTDCNANTIPDDCDLATAEPTPFANGIAVPEDIVPSPASYPSGYLIPNAQNGVIYNVSPDGSTVQPFAIGFDTPVGAVLVPDGSGGQGQLLIVADVGSGNPGKPDIVSVDADGALTPLAELPVISVTGLERISLGSGKSASWHILATAQTDMDGGLLGSVHLVSSSGQVTTILSSVGAQVFAPKLAPNDFGAFGGFVFMGEANGGDVLALNVQSRQAEHFATVPRQPNQVGLRQIAFSPAGWFDALDPSVTGKTLLLVSVAGSQTGGGTNGTVLVIDATGKLMAALKEHRQGLFLDPRGMYFAGDELLISNAAAGNILRVTVADFSLLDCNTNAVPDLCDIADLTSTDCDANGIPDECEADCNTNGIADACDIIDLTSTDCNRNRIPDECESDCNGNGFPDACDIDSGGSTDVNGNRIPDECEVLYVDASATGADSGVNWQNAFHDLQDALNAAAVTGVVREIRVAEGAYRPDIGAGQISGDRQSTFHLVSDVSVLGGFPAGGGDGSLGARDPRAFPTILSGDLLGDDPGICCSEHLTPGCDDSSCQSLICLTDPLCCSQAWSSACAAAAADICATCQNGGIGDNSFHVVTASGVDNTAQLDGFTITGGNADGTGQNATGGGILNVSGQPMIVACTVAGNSALRGGGMANLTGAAPTIVDSYFLRNVAVERGGAIDNVDSDPVIADSVFNANEAQTGPGGAVHNSSADPTIINCDLVNNVSAVQTGGVYNASGSRPTLTNTILYGNLDGTAGTESAQIASQPGFPGGPRVTYCVIEGLDRFATSPGNIGLDPQFVNPVGVDGVRGTLDDDLRTSAASPVIDAGNSTALPPDVTDRDHDGDVTEPLPLDFASRPRVVDIVTVPDTGIAGPKVVDIGCYEQQPGSPTHDECNQCIPLVTDQVYEGSNAGAGGADVSSCGFVDDADVWHCWTADCTGDVLVTLCGSEFNTTLSVFDDCSGMELACNDDGCAAGDGTSELLMSVTAGTTYYFRVAGNAGQVGDYSIRVSSCAQACCDASGLCSESPATDCVNAGGVPLPPDAVCLGDANANDIDDSCEVLPGACCLDDSSCLDATLAECDAYGGLFEGFTTECATLACPVASGACCVESTCFENVPREPCESLGGHWGGGRTSCGSYSCPPRPADDCNDATGIGSEGVYSFDNTDATTDGLSSPQCDFSGESQIDADMWYCWTSPCTAIVNVSTCGLTSINSRIAVYEGCDQCPPGDSELITCNDSGCGTLSLQSAVSFGAHSGNQYLIRVGNLPGSNPGVGALQIECGHSSCPGSGGCCDLDGTGTAGCDDATCCNAVCACDPFCCEVEWDQDCASAGFAGNGCGAQILCDDICNPCGDPDSGDCCAANGTPSCSDAACCEAVCACDPFCCNVMWDESCAGTGNAGSGCGAAVLCSQLCETDCNDNGIPDACDVSCGAQDGVCEFSFPGCGQSNDCDANGVPDECDEDCNLNGVVDACEIEQCSPQHPDYPGCSDCNLNGRPDVCDIDAASSFDVDQNGIPDECAQTTGAGATDSWSDGTNWNLDGQFPGGSPPSPFSVTLQNPGVDLLLDVNTSIDSLRLEPGTRLRLTESGSTGDLTVAGAGGLRIKGVMVLGSDRTLDVAAGRMTVRDGGMFIPDGVVKSLPGATVTLNSLTLLPTEFCLPEQFTIDNGMRVNVSGKLVMDGTGTILCPIPQGAVAAVKGGRTPPALRVTTTGVLAIAQTMSLLHSAGLTIGAIDAATSDQPTIELGGNFDNQSVFPSIFSWLSGRLILTGPSEQTFEVAGLDLGPTLEGFDTNEATMTEAGPHTNFSLTSLEVAAGQSVQFVNHVANTRGTGSCDEALYVRNLVLQDNAHITLNRCRIYYFNLQQGENVTVSTSGCGELVSICRLDPPLAEPNSMTRNRYIGFAGTNPGRQSAIRLTFADLPNPYDMLDAESLWIGPPQPVSELASHTDGTAPTMLASRLQCEPYYTDWSQFGLIHLVDPAIVPGANYALQTVSAECSAANEANFSVVGEFQTGLWGDVAGQFINGTWTPPNGVVDIATDVLPVLDKFSGSPMAPSKSRTDLAPGIPDEIVDVLDLTVVIDAFRGFSFPYVSPINIPDCPCLPGLDCDNDDVCDPNDNCPTIANTSQTDSDDDGYGDACDGPFDADHDGDIDRADYAGFAICLSGPAELATPQCTDVYSRSGAGAVDLADYAGLQNGYTGPHKGACR